jgi:site-specific recombinase XerC
MEKVFREARRATQRTVSVKTHYRYRESVKKFLGFCAERFRLQKVEKIGDKHVRAYIEWRRENGIREKTIKEDLSAIRFFHRYTGARRELAPNEAFGIGRTPQGGVDRAWTQGEYEKMLRLAEKLDRRDVVLTMRLARHAGLRIHECARLGRSDAEEALRTGILKVKGKGGKVREIPLRSEALEALREACVGIGRYEKLFVPPGEKTHKVIKRIEGFIYRHRGKVVEKEREITFHGLRHLYAREEYHSRAGKARGRWGERKARLEVSELLGHGRADVTRIYLGKGEN